MANEFRLQTIVRFREARRDAARAQLADALRAAETIEQQRQELGQRQSQLNAQRLAALNGGALDATWLLSAGRYDLALRADEQQINKNAEAIATEIERRRQIVAEAERDLRALETLRRRHDQRERKRAAKREAQRLDEFAIQSFHAEPQDGG